jgi:hypothetical protein
MNAMTQRLAAALRSRACLGVIVVADVVYKALAIFFPDVHGHGFNSDEAIVGLMALRTVEHGEIPLFFYGQLFGGGPEYLLATLVFTVLPPSIGTLRLATLIMRLATDALFYGVVRILFADRLQRHVALFLFVAMSSFFHGYLGRFSGVHLNNLLLGLATVWLFCSSQRLLHRPVWKGLVIGLGVWVSNVIFIFLIPAVVVGVARQAWARAKPRWSDLGRLLLLVTAAAIGCGPRLYYLTHRAAWHVGYQGGGFTLADWGWIRGRAGMLWPDTLPAYFYGGLAGGRAVWLAQIGVSLVVLSCAYATAVAVTGFFRKAEPSAVLVCLMGAFWLTLAAVVTNREVYNEGVRYLLAVQPFAAVSVALLLDPARAWPGDGAATAGTLRMSSALGVTLLLGALGVCGSFAAPARATEQRGPAHEEIIRLLDEQSVRYGFADYWASYDIAFRTRERIKLVPFYTNRIAAYDTEVNGARRKAYVFRISAPEDSDHYRKVLQLNAAAFQRLSREWRRDASRVTSREVGPYLLMIEMPPDDGVAGPPARR